MYNSEISLRIVKWFMKAWEIILEYFLQEAFCIQSPPDLHFM